MNNKYSAVTATAEPPKLSLPSINNNHVNNSSSREHSAGGLAELVASQEGQNDMRRPRAFKFGQVDQKMLMSRLYSTPLNKPSSHQQYVLDMGATSIHKPRIRRVENPPPLAEPVVIV